MKHLFTHRQLSQNPYTRRTQLIEIISELRCIWQNQKFSNDIQYSFVLLRDSINHFKVRLKKCEKEIKKIEETNVFFSELDNFGNDI